MTILRRTILLTCLACLAGPARATPSGLVSTFAACLGRFEAAEAPAPQRDAMRALVAAATPAALDWGMPEAHIRRAVKRAWLMQARLQADAAFAADARRAARLRARAAEGLAACQALLAFEAAPIPLPAGHPTR
jgi:hypothetical protein